MKKRKMTTPPSPQTIYTRVKYQSHYGSKNHSADVDGLMRNFIKEHCIDGKVIDSDPILAMDMSKAAFQAFYDNWQVMVRTGYDTEIFRARGP